MPVRPGRKRQGYVIGKRIHDTQVQTDERHSGTAATRSKPDNPAILGEVFDRHAAALLAVALHILGRPIEAEEILVAVFQALHQAPDAGIDRHGTLETWLMATTRRMALQRWQGLLAAPQRDDGTVTLGATMQHPGSERQQVIAAALHSLPPERRQILEMAYFQGLTPVEIATVLRRPVRAVAESLENALAHLQTLSRHFWGNDR
jgi:RNA polymerase sigma-70 factor (ECF subfamily)